MTGSINSTPVIHGIRHQPDVISANRKYEADSCRLRRAIACLAAIMILMPAAEARVTRITIERTESPAFEGKSHGNVGPYEILTGRVTGELNPDDPHNTIITDLSLAPRNAAGQVEYDATFTLLKPVNLAQSNGVLIYAVPNRGNRITPSAFGADGESGEEFFMKRGYIVLHSGWQGDLPPRPGSETIKVPVARNPDGTSITGPVIARLTDMPTGTKTLALPGVRTAASLDTTQATLTRRASEDGAIVPIASTDWAFADCRSTPFPGAPDPERISLRNGFDPNFLYELTYTAKDPLMLGIGFAATRDIVSFFRRERADAGGTANPLGSSVSHVIAQGISQAGNFVKTFIHLGFNADEEDRIVWDGANPHIAARQQPMNFRFAIPGGAASLYEPGSEGVLWWSKYRDDARGLAAASLLDRCQATGTCPKIFETFGSAEFWGLRMSPNLVGTKADVDIPLPSNVRRYYFPGTTHGGGRGGFVLKTTEPAGRYELPLNPNPQSDTMRALLVALTDWVTQGTEPPPSAYPRLDQGQLVRPDQRAMGFPTIPGQPLPDNMINPFYDYGFGPQFNRTDVSGVMTLQPPVIRGTVPQLVPKVDSDGNESSGVASVLHQAPLGSYLGWNVIRGGFYSGHGGGFQGGYIPYSETKAERLAAGDPRLSVAERYHDHAGYVAVVKKAANDLVSRRFLLPEDAARLIQQAEASDVLRQP